METVEQVYKGGSTSKKINREDSNCAGCISNNKLGEAALPSKPKKGRTGKRKERNADDRNNHSTKDKPCLLHGPGH